MNTGISTGHARPALAALATNLVDLPCCATSVDPLQWPGYEEELQEAQALSGESESVATAEGSINGRQVTLIAFEFDFFGGSIGEATGQRIISAIEHAATARHPLVSVIASGGARIQEGMRSLVQLQRIAAAVATARRAGLPHISVMRNPSVGGAWVALGSNADVIVAASGAEVGFLGSRARSDGSASVHFTAEGKQASGFVDVVADADAIPTLLGRYVTILGDTGREPNPCPPPQAIGEWNPPTHGWLAVQRARSSARPRAADFLDEIFTERVPISGDRTGGRDEGMLCGFGRHSDRTVAYAAQTGSRNTTAGFRTVTRLLRLADRLRFPVLTLIDTPGASDGPSAEKDGIGTAIGETFAVMAEISVPVTSVVVGEGGSGGALALVGPGPLWSMADSYFSVVAPEVAARIIYRDVDRAAEIADLLRPGPLDLVELGISSGICEC